MISSDCQVKAQNFGNGCHAEKLEEMRSVAKMQIQIPKRCKYKFLEDVNTNPKEMKYACMSALRQGPQDYIMMLMTCEMEIRPN